MDRPLNQKHFLCRWYLVAHLNVSGVRTQCSFNGTSKDLPDCSRHFLHYDQFGSLQDKQLFISVKSTYYLYFHFCSEFV